MEKAKMLHPNCKKILHSSLAKHIFPHPASIPAIYSLTINFGISVDAIVYKLKDIGIIGEKRYRGFCIQKNKRPDFKKRIEESRYEEKSTTRFQAMVYSALAQDLISTSKAATLLGVSINKVRNSATAI